MKKKFFPWLAVASMLCLIGAAGALSACFTTPLLDQRPNIILISVDTLRADHLHCYGYARETSPNMDQLAREGARFKRVISTAPWTLPAHITMLTGLETGVHNIQHSTSVLADSAVTVTEILKNAGYATVGFGCSPYLKGRYGYAQGFDVYDDQLGQIGYRKSHFQVTGKKVINKALDAIQERKNKRFFVFIHMWDPHYDYVPPAPYDKMFAADYQGDFSMHDFERNKQFRVGMSKADYDYTISQYDGEIAWTDSQLGRLVQTLKKWNLYDNTAIVITSDHGEEFLDHGQRGHGHSLFDELIRVPLIVKAPQVPAGTEISCAVSLVDLLPTLVEWAKVKESPYRGPGLNLLDLIFNRRPCNPTRELFSETPMSNLDKLHAPKRGYEMMLEMDQSKFHQRTTEPLRELLFHIPADPWEQTDLLGAEADRAAAMRELASRHRQNNDRLRRQLHLARKKKLDEQTNRQLKDLGYIQ